MNNEKIAPKVFPNFHKQLKDGKIPFYISNILQSTLETSDAKCLENRLIECTSFLEDDVKLKNIFLNFGWDEKKKKFCKEINYKELDEIIGKEYEIGFFENGKDNFTYVSEVIFPEKAKNNFAMEVEDKEKNKLGSRVMHKNLSFPVSGDFEEKLLKNPNKKLDNNTTQMEIDSNEITDHKEEKPSKAYKTLLYPNENPEINLALKTGKKEEIADSNKTENTSELEKGLNETETNNNSNINTRNFIKSTSKSYKALMFNNKKTLSIAGEEDFDEDSASIKKPIATTVSSNSYPFDYSKIISIQNEQNKNPIINTINVFNNINNSNNNEENLNMQSMLNNSYPNLIINDKNNNFCNNLKNKISSPSISFNKNFNNVSNNNSNNTNNNNYFFNESEINNQSDIPKIITPKFNKIIPTITNNPLNNLNPSANFIPNNINNNILININNTGLPIETNHLPLNANPNLNPYLIPNSPTMHYNSTIFTKSNFTKNPSNFSCHASPGNGFGFNSSSAFNANPHLKGVVPLNSPHSVKSLDLNQAGLMNTNSLNFPANQNFYYFNNMNNNKNNNNNLNSYNNNSNFYNSIEELNKKYSMSNAGSINSNKVSGNNHLKIKSKNLSFYEAEEENENQEDYKNEKKEAQNKLNYKTIHNRKTINKRNSAAKYKINRNKTNNNNNSNNFYKNKTEIYENQIGNYENYSLNDKNNNNFINIKKNYSLKNQYNSLELEMRNNINLNSSNKLKEADNTENKILTNNLNNKQDFAEALESHWNPNVSVISNEKNEICVLIDRKVFSETAENFGLPILEELTNNINPKSILKPLEGGRHKRSIQRNKRFFDEENFHFDNSFRKIVTPKNSENSGNIRNFINSNMINNSENIGSNSYFNGNSGSGARNNFIKRKRKKMSKLGDSNIKKIINDDAKNNIKINNNLSFCEYNFGNGKRKYKKRKKNENLDKEPPAHSSGEDEENSQNNDYNINNFHNKGNNGTIFAFPTTANKNSRLTKLKSNRIYQSGQSNFLPNSFENNFNNPNYNHNFYCLSLEENRVKAQMGRRRKRRGKNQKSQMSEANRSRQSSQKRFFNSRNTSYGLKEISKNVLKIVKRSKSTTYKEISDMIVRDINADLNGTKDEKNIRRRIYDSLNVMKAMNIFKKERNLKNIVFNNTSQNAFLFRMLERDDSFRSTPRTAQQPPKGLLLQDYVQPLKASFFRDNYAFGSGKHASGYFNYGYNQVNNNFKDASENGDCNEYQRKIQGEREHIHESYMDEEINKADENINYIKNNNCPIKENQDICYPDSNKSIKNIHVNTNSNNYYLNENTKESNKEKELDVNGNKDFHLQQVKENLEAKAKQEHSEHNRFTQKEASMINKTQNLLQRKLSSESNFRPTACNSNTNINNNININIFNNFVKSNPCENPLYYNNTLRASNLNLPTGIDSCLSYFPYNLNLNNNFNCSAFNLNTNSSLNYNIFQNNANYNQMIGDPFYHNAKENREEACFNYRIQDCRSKKQMIERLKIYIADKKRILNAKLVEVNLLKYNSDLVRRLINYNKKNAENIKEDDKIRFPFLCVEFPSYKKSEVNLVINEEKTKLYCNFEDEVNIYGDLDLIKKISKINSFEN